MQVKEILSDKYLKPKEKVILIRQLLIDKKISADDLINTAEHEKESAQANCIEALELATKEQPQIAGLKAFQFVSRQLKSGVPRIKWESARVICNTANLFPTHLDEAIKNLLENSEHEGVVVRWSTATALAAIIQLNTSYNIDLIPAIESLGRNEIKLSIKKIYLSATAKK